MRSGCWLQNAAGDYNTVDIEPLVIETFPFCEMLARGCMLANTIQSSIFDPSFELRYPGSQGRAPQITAPQVGSSATFPLGLHRQQKSVFGSDIRCDVDFKTSDL